MKGTQARPLQIMGKQFLTAANSTRFTLLVPPKGESIIFMGLKIFQVGAESIDHFLEIYFGEDSAMLDAEPESRTTDRQNIDMVRASATSENTASQRFSLTTGPIGLPNEILSARWLSSPNGAHRTYLTYALKGGVGLRKR